MEDRTGTDIYGFPALDGPDGGATVVLHDKGAAVDPDQVDREIHRSVVRGRQVCSQQCRRPYLLGSASNQLGVNTQSAGT
ncbi:hypothetical protein QF032_000395 [Streptomyces achromogenes]|nr:hypothetical protein [Streptomyces achromogenes]